MPMAAHAWLFPWIALAAGLAALLAGGARSRLRVRPVLLSPPPLPFLIVWLVAAAAVFLFNRHLGTAAGVDVIPARGILLGSLAGLLLVQMCRATPTPGMPMLFGLGTAVVVAGRLWLTHGEQSGLTAVAAGAALAVLCLSIAPAVLRPAADSEASDQATFPGTLGLLFLVSLAAATEIGFTRADEVARMYWADLPLLLAGALCLGSVAGMGGAQGSRNGITAVMPLLTTLAVGLGAGFFASRLLVHEWTPLKLLGLGAVTFGLLATLCRREAPSSESALPCPWDASALAGLLLVVLAATLAFAFWTGYGLGLLVLGGWMIVPWALATPAPNSGGADAGGAWRVMPPMMSGFAFATVLLLHRLLLLQSGHEIRANGPADTWDLFAICLGALLPMGLAAWVSRRPGGWPALIEWLAGLLIPSLLVGYVLGERAVAGVVLGIALGQLLVGMSASDRGRTQVTALNGVLAGLILLQFLPLLGQMDEPTRRVRSAILLAVAGVIALRVLIPEGAFKPRRFRLRGAR